MDRCTCRDRETYMKYLLPLLLLSTIAHADDYKFHYGDQVKVKFATLAKPNFKNEFVNVSDKIGIVISVRDGLSICEHIYEVKFDFGDDLVRQTKDYCEMDLKKVLKHK